jgi:hypothetical protein
MFDESWWFRCNHDNQKVIDSNAAMSASDKRAVLIKQALAKLTDEEQKALGF